MIFSAHLADKQLETHPIDLELNEIVQLWVGACTASAEGGMFMTSRILLWIYINWTPIQLRIVNLERYYGILVNKTRF